MKIKNILQESMTHTVYHSTNITRLLPILHYDEFKLKPKINQNPLEIEKTKKFKYRGSFARSPQSGYLIRQAAPYTSRIAVLVIDGDKLNNNYHSKPISYFSKLSDSEKKEYAAESSGTYFHFDEMEDRLYSNKPTIPNFKKYIKEIHVFFNKNDDNIEKYMNGLKKYANIKPIYIYKDINNFKALAKKKAEKL